MKVKEIFKNKKIAVTVASVLAIVGVTVGATMAYVSSKTGTLTNTFAVGSVDTELDEVISELNKVPYVTNTGKSDCIVRIRKTISPDNLGIETVGDEKYKCKYKGQEYYWNKDDWKEDGEFYYYTKILAPGESTTPLFTKVILPEDWYKVDEKGNKVIDETKFVAFDIGLYQEAVQARAFDKDGKEIKAYTVENDQKVYNGENAKIIWNSYDGAQ